jgi:hypothetical protein
MQPFISLHPPTTRPILTPKLEQRSFCSAQNPASFGVKLAYGVVFTGNKASSSLENLNHTIISSILKDSEFLSQLAIDIMDRNLYERANDCRWWALNSDFKEALESGNFDKKMLESLKYINSLYTLYTNLIIFDKSV